MDLNEAMEKGIPSFFFHINIETALYAIKEIGSDLSNCENSYNIINNKLGIEAGRFGGRHSLNVFFERLKKESGFSGKINELIEKYDAKTIDFLVKNYRMKDIAVIYTERKLSEAEVKKVKEVVPDFWYVGTLKFGKNSCIEKFEPN